MFTIGDFARLGGVSVRMLRHYDEIGALHPAHVDPATGYRFYEAGQLSRLNRLVALVDLGFTLAQVGPILDGAVSAAELRGMYRLRQAELSERITTDTQRLDRVERRLRTIEKETDMSDVDVSIQALPSARVAVVHGIADSIEQIGQVIAPLYGRLSQALVRDGIPLKDAALAYYDLPDDGSVQVHAGFPAGQAEPCADYDVVELPAEDRAATVKHIGPMDTIGQTWQALGRWIEENGYRSGGSSAREVYLHMPMDDPASWITEIQWPVQLA